MPEDYYTITEVLKIFQMEERMLVDLEREEIVSPTFADDAQTKLFSVEEMEKLRFAKILIEDMGVNLAGVEVILRMRKNMFEMRRQFDTILEDLARQLQVTFKDRF
jgi:MerR family transcriptional regulator/heat shock protein HspR